MARVRSPNYPAISLREAVDRLNQLFNKAQNRLISREQAAEAMGYDGLHGASLGAISALLKFGLLEKVGSQLKVSERGMSVIAPHDFDEGQSAINEAAFDPALFGELRERFLGVIPSDEKLRTFLIRKGFSSSALDRVVRSYRETMEMVTSDSEDLDMTEARPLVEEKSMHSVEGSSSAPTTRLPIGTMRVSIVDDRLEVTANLSDSESVDKLIRVLQANKELLPQKEVPETARSYSETLGNLENEKGGVPFIITREQRAVLGALGYTEDKIREMTPGEAHHILNLNKKASN